MVILAKQAPDVVARVRELLDKEIKVLRAIEGVPVGDFQLQWADAQPLVVQLATLCLSIKAERLPAELLRPKASHIDLHDVHILALDSHALDLGSNSNECLAAVGPARNLHQDMVARLHEVELLPEDVLHVRVAKGPRFRHAVLPHRLPGLWGREVSALADAALVAHLRGGIAHVLV